MYIDFSFGVNDIDDYYNLQKGLTEILRDKGKITESGIKLLCTIGEIRVELYDKSMNINDFIFKVRKLGFPQDTVYRIDGKDTKLFSRENISEGCIKALLKDLRYHSRWLDWEECEEMQPASVTLELVREVWESNPIKNNRLKNGWISRLPHLQLDDEEIIRRLALLLEDEVNGNSIYRIEHDNLYFDIYNRGVKEVSIRYNKEKDELKYAFYTEVCYLRKNLTLGSIHFFLQSRIGDIYIKRGEELEFLRKTKGKLLKDHLILKFYKRNMPIENIIGRN